MEQKKDLYLSDITEIIQEFYKDTETVGTTDAIFNVIYKAYTAGVNSANK